MNTRTLLQLSGIDQHVWFSPLWSNWVREQDRLHSSGITVKPTRFGAKRVVLAGASRVKRKKSNALIAALAALAFALVGAFILVPLPSGKAKTLTVPSQNCLPVTEGSLLSQGSIRDWRFVLSDQIAIGQLLSYRFQASCAQKKMSGKLIAAITKTGLEIKRINPAN